MISKLKAVRHFLIEEEGPTSWYAIMLAMIIGVCIVAVVYLAGEPETASIHLQERSQGQSQLVVSPTGAVKTMDSISQASATRRRILIDSGVKAFLFEELVSTLLQLGYLVIVFVLSDALSHPRESIAESVFRCLDEAVF